jgi:hypothetical protein
VATDIDADSHDLVQLTPSDAVRTGGDPVPWSGDGPDGSSRGFYGDPAAELRPEPSSRRRSDRSTIPVEPDEDAAPPWSTDTTQPARMPGAPRPEVLPPDDPPEPPTRTQTAVEAPEQPWLTQTESSGPLQTGNGVAQVEDDPPQRPPADYRTSGRDASRSDEIRGSSDRPWIALPIEPDDPPER